MRRLEWTGLGLLALMLVASGCDENGGDNAPRPCPPESCCAGDCCANPATGTGAGSLPPRPTAPAASGSASSVFAISKMYFGDTDRAGNLSTTAWKTFGLNIDGKVTSANATDVCTLAPGASRCTQLDGDDGIDNSFGENIMSIVTTLTEGYDSYADGAIQKGGGTMLVQLDGLASSDGYSLLPGALYRAIPTSQPPRWDGTDVRDVDSVSLVGGDVSRPIALLQSGYMSHRVWVSGLASGAAYLDLQVTSGTGPTLLPPIPLQHVQVAMQVAPGNGSATSGTIAAVARTRDVVAFLQEWAGTISTSLCSGSAFESISLQAEQTGDIMVDGSNEPGKQCDGISVGLGFDAVAVRLGKAESEPPFVNPCEDAGADALSE